MSIPREPPSLQDSAGAPIFPALEDCYRPRDELQFTVMDGEAVIVDLASNTYFTLNPTGTIVWETIDRRVPLSMAVVRLCEQFEVAEPVARRDVQSLVGELLASKLIHKDG